MANMNSNSNFSDDEMDISGIYGMENFMGGSSQNLEDLAGYNLTDSAWNGSMNNTNVGNNAANIQSSNGGNRPQNTMNRPNNANRPQDAMNNSLSPQPQRQEQTMPMNREPQTEMGMQNNNTWGNMQSVGNIEDFFQQAHVCAAGGVPKNGAAHRLLHAEQVFRHSRPAFGVEQRGHIPLRLV